MCDVETIKFTQIIVISKAGKSPKKTESYNRSILSLYQFCKKIFLKKVITTHKTMLKIVGNTISLHQFDCKYISCRQQNRK